MGLRDFLLPLLQFDPAKRASAADMLDHPWLRGELPQRPPPGQVGGSVDESRSVSPVARAREP